MAGIIVGRGVVGISVGESVGDEVGGTVGAWVGDTVGGKVCGLGIGVGKGVGFKVGNKVGGSEAAKPGLLSILTFSTSSTGRPMLVNCALIVSLPTSEFI